MSRAIKIMIQVNDEQAFSDQEIIDAIITKQTAYEIIDSTSTELYKTIPIVIVEDWCLI